MPYLMIKVLTIHTNNILSFDQLGHGVVVVSSHEPNTADLTQRHGVIITSSP